MGQITIHDEAYCECVKYKPKLTQYGIKFNGVNFRCKRCGRYVDPKKWKGGIVKLTNRVRFVKANECPCCGWKMGRHRRAKKKLVDSIKHQQEFPEQHLITPRALKKKVRLLESGVLFPSVT